MHSTVLHKRSTTPGNTPASTILSAGEIALNIADGKMFVKATDNSVKTFLNSDLLPYTLDQSLSSVNCQHGDNTVTEILGGVLGGISNSVSGAGSTIINGSDNTIAADYAVIGNGSNNEVTAQGDYGAILGGQNNTLSHQESFILGSNISSHLSGFTYVNNLSAAGKLHGDGSELTGIVAGDTEATTLVRSNSANWESVYTTFKEASSSFLTSETDSQTLAFDEGTKELTISTGNTVSLSSFSSTINSVSSQLVLTTSLDNYKTEVASATSTLLPTSVYQSASGAWQSAYNTVQSNSASNWDNSSVTTYIDNNFVPLAGGTITGSLSVLGNLTYIDTSIAVTSAMYIDTSSAETALRITQRGPGDVIRVEDSDNPDATPFIINSDGLVGVGTSAPNEEFTVAGNISATGFYYGDGSNLTGIVAGDTEATTLVRSNSANWQTGYDYGTIYSSNSSSYVTETTVNNLSSQLLLSTIYQNASGDWETVYTLVQTESASWGTGGNPQTLSFDESTKNLSISPGGNTVSLSAFGSGADTEVRALTSNWQTTFQASSAYVSSNPEGITGASALTKLIQITQAGYNAITPASDTLYVIVG